MALKKKTVKAWASSSYANGFTKQDVSLFVYRKRPDRAYHWVPVTVTFSLPLTKIKK